MTPIDTIILDIKTSTKSIDLHSDYPNTPGLYAFTLSTKASLGVFGKENQIIYVGKAEDSLTARDLNTHFKDGATGRSTLRRSIGAILKKELKATAFSRNGTLNPSNINNYKFDSLTEQKLTEWMRANLRIGYWQYHPLVEQTPLATIEEQLIRKLRPTLDLDRRTVHLNTNATTLKFLRQICKDEAQLNVVNNNLYF